MTRKKLLIWVPVAAILLNGLGYLIVSKMRTPPAPGPGYKVTALDRPVAPPAAADQPAAPAGPAEAPDAIRAAEADRKREETAMARRAVGIAALEAGEYDKALVAFADAKSLVGDKARVDDLVLVAGQLRKHPPASNPKARDSGAVSAGPRPARGAKERHLAAREEMAPEPQAPSSPAGLLIVTTTPRGLLVKIDDTAVDLTPMRTRIRPGPHRVALLDGDRKVYETNIEVSEGATATLIKDLPIDLGNESSRAASAPARAPASGSPAPTAAREGATALAPEPMAPPAPRPSVATAPPAIAASSSSGSKGALAITSPGLYGVVWINGRPRGYPPLEVRDLPAGPAKVEVRVNGVQKRVSRVVVQPGSTTPISLR